MFIRKGKNDESIFKDRVIGDKTYPYQEVVSYIQEAVNLYMRDTNKTVVDFSEHILEANDITLENLDMADEKHNVNVAVMTAMAHNDEVLLEQYSKAVGKLLDIEKMMVERYKENDTFKVIHEASTDVINSLIKKDGE